MQKHLIQSAQKALPKNAPHTLHDFIERFFEEVPDEDIQFLDPVTMARTAETHWDLLKEYKGKAPCIKIHTPTLDQDDWSIRRTVIDIVVEDMAFALDSIVAEVMRHNFIIAFLVNTAVNVKKDSRGAIRAVERQENGESKKQKADLHLHIQLSHIITDKQMKELEEGLHNVLRDVDFATRDWLRMKKKLIDAQKSLSFSPKKYDDHLIEEYQAFLQYLHDDNFTLLGFREYKFVKRNGDLKSQIVKGSSLGLLSDEMAPVYVNEARTSLSQQHQKLRYDQEPLTIAKVNKKSTVHRRVPLDAIAVKLYSPKGETLGELLFIGLFTSVTYSRSVQDVPLIRLKVNSVIYQTNAQASNHERKALKHILEKYPRDEIFQIPIDDLRDHALSILRLQERPRIALYARLDPFGRYISCLVYIPRERYDTRLRKKLMAVLEETLGGHCTNFYATQDDSTLARVIYFIDINKLPKIPEFETKFVEDKLIQAGRVWSEELRYALEDFHEKEEDIADQLDRYGEAFPVNYQDRYAQKEAVKDIQKIEGLSEDHIIDLNLYQPNNCDPNTFRLKIYSKDAPIPLSNVLPVLENMGLLVVSELPFQVNPGRGDEKIWIHDFFIKAENTNSEIDFEDVKELFETAFLKVWHGDMENDSLNKLVLHAQIDWREVSVLRAYVRYLRQIQYPYSKTYIETTLTTHPGLSALLVKLFTLRHDPEQEEKDNVDAAGCAVEIDHRLDDVPSLDHDRIIRGVIGCIQATLRTNFFQKDADGHFKTYLSLKLDSAHIPNLPKPVPYREIFVYSPRVEGIHLRGGPIARGGIRWSDRPEDFRTEVLGLMKAQMVKNSLIVPMGAKGGFILKRPMTGKDREAFQAEGIACYKIFIQGLLDITDNRKGNRIIHPENVVRHDGDDPYLVVAADKGTATFSDIANGISQDYGFWLDDAFASGGSAGYDHKKMGITARGAWESVKRHFRELNHDTQTQPFDVVGIGDMGGDVFGNGMLLSKHIKLIAAFNHLHIFCDPDPNPEVGFAERERLFKDVKGWDAYDQRKLSKGGKIFSRQDKNLELTPEIKARFDLDSDKVTPIELIRAILKARTDLLWFGGIGTYIKAKHEDHADVGDKANDNLRIDVQDIRAKVIGEGANLGVTQAARIAFDKKGGRINADFIDNSGGVDSSDHEVNIKILLGELVRSKGQNNLTLQQRNKLLASMTNNVADHVLENNYQHAQAISLLEYQAAEKLSSHAEFIRTLERDYGLDRALEGLPDEEEIQERLKKNKGLTRPELGIIMAYAKINLTQTILDSDIPDNSVVSSWAVSYFPKKIQDQYKDQILKHQLKREIIATYIAGEIVNRCGPTFIETQIEKTGAKSIDIIRSYLIAREIFSLERLWNEIEALDSRTPAQTQIKALKKIDRLLERVTGWFLTRLARSLDIERDIEKFKPGIQSLKEKLPSVLGDSLRKSLDAKILDTMGNGLTEKVAEDLAFLPALSSGCDIIGLAESEESDIGQAAALYFEIGDYFHMDWLRTQARYVSTGDYWSQKALESLTDDLYSCQAGLTARVLSDVTGAAARKKNGQSLFERWASENQDLFENLQTMLSEFKQKGSLDLPMLIIVEQRLRALYGG